MKVVLTGSTGQLGTALLKSCPSKVELLPLSRSELDLANETAIDDVLHRHRPSLVINAAAYTAVDRAETDEAAARAINALAPGRLARAAASIQARLIHVSTDYVFDGDSARPYQPQDSTGPLSVYGRTKLEGERAVLEALPTASIVLRTAWVYAATGHNFLKTMLRLMSEKGAVRVVADQVGCPTAASSIAAAIWRFVERPKLTGVYHWTDAGVASWYDFAVAIAEEAAAIGMIGECSVTPIATEDYPTPARRPRFSLLDSRASWDALGLAPVHWRVWLRRVLGELQGA